MTLPHTFAAVDPETGRELSFRSPRSYWEPFQIIDPDLEYPDSLIDSMRPDVARALIQHGRQLERERITKDLSCPDCGEPFSEYVLHEHGWGNTPMSDEQAKALLEKHGRKTVSKEQAWDLIACEDCGLANKPIKFLRVYQHEGEDTYALHYCEDCGEIFEEDGRYDIRFIEEPKNG